MDLNVINVSGRLGRDAELKHMKGGDAVLEFSIAVNGYKKDAPPTWLGVKVWGKRGEALGKLGLEKGTRVIVSGRLQVREYQRKDGGNGTAVEVVANDVVLLGSRNEKRGDSGSSSADEAPPDDGGGGDDLPF